MLYSEQQTVTIAEGEFSVLVGQGTGTSIQTFGYSETNKGPSGSPAVSLPNVFNGATRYLGVTVAAGASIQLTDNEITPRQQIVGSAFAFRARFAESIGSNGVSAITAVDGGNVGVGTSAPPALFTISGSNNSSTTNTPQLVITDPADLNERLLIGMNSTNNGSGFIQATKVGPGGQNLLLNPNGGNVGIGTTTPASRLDVNGQLTLANDNNWLSGGIRFRSSNGTVDGGIVQGVTGGLVYRAPANDGAAGHQFVNGGGSATLMTITNAGNVGLGTTSPSSPLFVAARAATSPDSNGIMLANPNNSANNHAIMAVRTQTSGGNPMIAFDVVSAAGYTIGIDNADKRLKISRDWGNFSNTMMTFTGSGDVGIGTNTPTYKLDVIGGTQSQYLELRAPAQMPYIDFSSTAGADYHARIIWQGTTTNRLDFEAPRFLFTGGRIGVGTSTPTCPLDVRGGTDVVLNGNYTSIRSEWFVQAFGYGTMSDQRIKQIVDRSSSVSDLDTVMKLQVTNYQMKAQVMKGNPVQKGLIAQEVEKVIPEAVLKSEAYVPEIFELAKQAKYDAESKSLKVTMGKPHGLAVGDMVMITSKDAETDQSHYLKVAQVTDEKAFVVGDVAAEIKKAFVFGKQVKDFRSVDYNRVYTTGIGAIQQLKREKDSEIKELKDENEALKTRVIALEAQTQRLADLEAKDKAREAKLAAIEKLLLAADKAAVKPVSLKKSAGGAE